MKRLTIGIVIGLLMGISTNAFAAIGDRVEAVFAEFKFVVDGEAKTLDSPVLVHDGNSYLRTTHIVNMLGYDVTYKQDSRTIEFDKPVTGDISAPIKPQPAPIEINVPPVVRPVPIAQPIIQPISPPIIQPSAPAAPPVVDNTLVCQRIRDDYAYRIAALPYGAKNDLGHQRYYQLILEHNRDRELEDNKCN